ncbi:MAG: hypothetical protein CVU63_13485, partial [Deltaproteobacteria bacterium HGW-Deltaproteobacteria-20]
MMYGSPGSAAVSEAVHQALSRPSPAGLAPIPDEPFQVLASREEQPSKSSPLTYREYAYAITEGSSEGDAEKFILQRFAEIQQDLAATRTAKLVNLAVFDHAFKDRPKRPPLVTLVWKDWKGDPELRYTSRPGVSIPPPTLGQASSRPRAQTVEPAQAPKPAETSQPVVQPAPVVQP